MEYTTRSQRFKWLHDKVNREINKSTILQTENNQLAGVMEKLDAIDKKFFREKLNEFMAEQQLSKPYLETAKNNLVLSDDEVLELRKISNELKKVVPSEQRKVEEEVVNEEDELNGELFSEENAQLRERLTDIIKWLNEKIEAYNVNEVKKNPAIETVPMADVQRMRNRDPRDIKTLNADINENEIMIDNHRHRANAFVISSKQLRWVKIVLPILVAALVLVAVAIALVLVL